MGRGVQTLLSVVSEWRQRASSSENKCNLTRLRAGSAFAIASVPFVPRKMLLCPLVHLPSPQPQQQLSNGFPLYQTAASVRVWCSLGAINPTLLGPRGLTLPVDSVCAADPGNTSQRCRAHIHTHSSQAVPCYGYQASRKPQNLPFQARQAFRQEKQHVRETQTWSNQSHCRTFR